MRSNDDGNMPALCLVLSEILINGNTCIILLPCFALKELIRPCPSFLGDVSGVSWLLSLLTVLNPSFHLVSPLH